MKIKDFKELMLRHNPCKEGLDAFEKCTSRKDVFDLIASPIAYDFLMKSVRDGWGPTPDDIAQIFKYYVNGRCTTIFRDEMRSIRSQVWCNSKEVKVDDKIRTMILFGCHGDIEIGKWQVVRLIVDKNCDIDIICPDSSAYVIVENYGGSVYDMYGNCNIYER